MTFMDFVKITALAIVAGVVVYMIYLCVKYPHADDYPNPWDMT